MWSPVTYLVWYDGNGAEGSIPPQSLTFDKAEKLNKNELSLPSKAFTGWNTLPDGSGTAYADEETVENLASVQDAAVTLYAIWEGGPFTVRFDGNKPSGASTALTGSMADQELDPGETQSLTSNAFTLPGYVFTAWNTAPDGSGFSLGDGEDGSSLGALGKLVTLYAQWAPVTYTVIFDPNGAEGSMPPQTLTFDMAEKLNKSELSLSGKAFTGWNTLPDGSGTAYADEETVENLASVQDAAVTLYAIWEGGPFTVRFNGNKPSGASTVLTGSMADQELDPGETQSLTANAFTLPGYVFTAWNTAPDGSGFSLGDGEDGSSLGALGKLVALYAQWKPITYTVIFDPIGAEGSMLPQTLIFDRAEKLDKNELSLPGKAFTGWNTLPDGSGTAYSDEETVANLASVQGAAVTLYAQWTYAFYTVEYQPNGASGSSFRRDIAVGVQTSAEKSPFTRKGYTFTGWSTEPEKGGIVYRPGDAFTDLAPAGKTVVLYARWSVVPKTGDGSRPLLWTALAVASGCGLVSVRSRKRTRHAAD